MNWRKHGFTQRKPREPGVYFVAGDLLKPLAPPQRLRQGWDVASVMFWAGSYTNAHDNRESVAHWRITTLNGVDYAWKPGMWLKGPISPLQPNADVTGLAPEGDKS